MTKDLPISVNATPQLPLPHRVAKDLVFKSKL
jgi:hypothetical protein